jgi:hypothetical protein
MQKFLALPIIQTNEMYGYSTIVVPLTDENITKVNDLKSNFESIKKLYPSISSVTYYNIMFDYDVMNDTLDIDLDEDNANIIQLSEEDYEKYSDTSDCNCRIDDSYIVVDDRGIRIVYNAKWTADEVYTSLYFILLDKIEVTE